MNSKSSIPDVLQRLGITHQGRAFSCPNPAHPKGDKHPSAGFFGPGDSKFKCHSCGEIGDDADLVRLAKSCSYREARAFLDGNSNGQSSPTTTRHATRQAGRPGGRTKVIVVKGQRITINPTPDEPIRPDLRLGSEAEIEQVAKLRGISAGALRFAQRWGVLRFGDAASVGPFWCMTDATGHATEARRLDGELWPKTGRKAWAFAGSRKDWPLGLRSDTPADNNRVILLCEGPPDALAALDLLGLAGRGNVLPCAMLGSAATLGEESLQMIAGRPCIVWAQPDPAGEEAGRRWGATLTEAGSQVRVIVPFEDGDVCDWNRARPTREEVRAALPTFAMEGGEA